jgi:transposase
MENKRLNQTEIKKLIQKNKSIRSKAESDRIRCIIYWGKGWSWKNIKEALFISDATIKSYIDKYKNGGIDELLTIRYEGNNNKLTKEQENHIKDFIKSRFAITTEDVCKYVKNTFNIQYTINGMTKTLLRLGFTYKETDKEPFEIDPYLQGIHFGFSYIKKVLELREDEYLYFINAGKVLYNPNLNYGWVDKSLEQCDNKTLNINIEANIAYNLKTNEIITAKSVQDNTNSIKSLVKKLIDKNEGAQRLTIMVYNASKGKLRMIKSQIKKNPSDTKIELIEVPSYNPILNIDNDVHS